MRDETKLDAIKTLVILKIKPFNFYLPTSNIEKGRNLINLSLLDFIFLK